MPEWKKEIKRIAEDFCTSQVKINKILKYVEEEYSQRSIPNYYKGNKDEYLYDVAQKEMMKLIFT